jgi:hypothetical protein
MLQNISLVCFILIFIYLYLYVKKEHFAADNTPLPTFAVPRLESDVPISKQLTSEISRVLKLSERRITNLLFKGDVSSGILNVIFIILEPNPVEIVNKEKPAKDYAIIATNLFNSGNFKVYINGINITLKKLNIKNENKKINNFFDNTGLIDISKYSENKYNSVPNDESLTKFYKLDIDDNFNIKPKI